ncbi:MAG TPA: aminotransferase class V-fold PLP-dependent enzyme [Gemmatimonadaceae bacterium]|nr:aminotransferase class V-fold PLP-dependent enzyme [Gemmatimonadaceae bacterium]
MTTNEQLDRWRNDTPGTAHRNHMNNAGAALMPSPVISAITQHIELEANIGGYEAADAAAAEIDRGYDDLASLVGAKARNIAVVANATAGFIQAVSSFDFSPGDVIVTSRCDYTSNQIQYLALHNRLGVEIVHADDLPEGGVDPDAVRRAIERAGRDRCKLVAVSWIPTNSGLVQDVAGVGAVCEALGVPYLVDACQAVGQIPIDVAGLRCDYLSATGRKFLRGPRGIGFMFASDRALARGDYPLFVDMRGARWSAPDQYELEPTARRYEDWEFPYALVLGQAAAARYALDVGIDVAQRRAWDLATRLRTGLEQIPRVHVLDRGATRCAIVTASADGVDARDLSQDLAAQNINSVATLREFGQFDFVAKGVESAIRLSPHYYNSEAEVDAAVRAVSSFVDR